VAVIVVDSAEVLAVEAAVRGATAVTEVVVGDADVDAVAGDAGDEERKRRNGFQ
jgi:hypothetical protein